MKITIATTDADLVIQVKKFLDNYDTYESILNIDATKITNLDKGLEMFTFIVDEHEVIKTFGTTFTSYKNAVRNGSQTILLTAIPTLAAYTTPLPALCNEGLEGLFREIAKDCVDTGLLNETMAIALGLFELATPVDLTKGTPNLTAKPSSAGHPKLHCTLGAYDAYEIWKDEGTGFLKLDVSVTSDYIDNSPLPALGVSAVWNYKIIYRYKNAQIGNWSVTLSIAVKGNV